MSWMIAEDCHAKRALFNFSNGPFKCIVLILASHFRFYTEAKDGNKRCARGVAIAVMIIAATLATGVKLPGARYDCKVVSSFLDS